MVRIYFLGSKDSPLRRTRIYDWKYDNTEGYVEGQSSSEKYMVYDNIRNKKMGTKSSGSNRHISTCYISDRLYEDKRSGKINHRTLSIPTQKG
jgi:hypothetical protein